MPTPPRLLASLALFFVAGVLAQAKSESKLQELGDNTYAITRTATSGFDRDAGKFQREAREDAEKFCATKGKTLKIVSLTSDRPHFGGGFTWAKITFRALEAGDPALAAPVTTAAPASAAAAPAGMLPTYEGDLYSELLKLDDLRKRGILTDKEFEQQKKKLLKKSK